MILREEKKKGKKQPTCQLCRCGEKRMCNISRVTALRLPKDLRVKKQHKNLQQIFLIINIARLMVKMKEEHEIQYTYQGI